jgi:hypothetical protein
MDDPRYISEGVYNSIYGYFKMNDPECKKIILYLIENLAVQGFLFILILIPV